MLFRASVLMDWLAGTVPPAPTLRGTEVTPLEAVKNGTQITNGPQSISKLRSGRYLLFCDTPGCCDCEMTDSELAEYLATDDSDWGTPNVELSGPTAASSPEGPAQTQG